MMMMMILYHSQRKETLDDGSVKHLKMIDGEEIVADEYISAVPVDIMKRIMPKQWAPMPFFAQIKELEGIPVINIHMWFDRKLKVGRRKLDPSLKAPGFKL